MRRGSTGPAGAPGRSWRSWSLSVDLAGFVLLAVVLAGANVVYQRRAAANEARKAAAADAAFAATVGASDVTASIGLVRTTVAATAGNPGIMQAFTAPAGCTLTFGGAGVFGAGHLDIVGRDGTVVCSSLLATKTRGYGGAAWLAEALQSSIVLGPVTDSRSGKQVMVVASPIAGEGAVVAFLDLEALGPGLASTLGGPRHLEFVVTTVGTGVVLARSIDPTHWVGVSTAGTKFATSAAHVERPDLDGTPRLYGQAIVPTLGWEVFAGASKSGALAAATRLNDRELVITLAELIVLLSGALLLYRRVARPIDLLRAGVRAAATRQSSGPISVGGPAEVSALVEDFNGLIEAADRELIANSRLAAIVESSADAVFGKTLDGEITSWNAGAEQMFGYLAAEIVGRNVSILIPADRADELEPILRGVQRGERVVQFETKRVAEDGKILDVSITVSPIRDASGQVVGASTVSRDMTEHNRIEADRRALEDRLRQSERLESMGQLAGGIAHDFNNLLAAIINYADFVADETTDRPAVRADVEQIRIAAKRAARLTKQLLIFGRRDTIQPEALDLNASVADINNLLARSIGEHIELSVEAGAALPRITADRGQIEQVLLNLAVNARDAMPDGGTLTIETRPVELDEGYAALHPDARPGHYVELAVSDTGIGMNAEVQAHIFEPFFTTKPKGEGTGLGLATVYGIVTESAGTMSVYSEEGIGTTFRLYFPATDEGAAPPPAAAPTLPRGKGETILVVEDEPAVLELTSRILRQSGYAVLEAGTFEEALSLAATSEFQLLLTDSVMPHMSGRQLAARVAEMRPGQAVLFMSGYSEGVLGPKRVLDQGVALLQKPFNRQTLIEHVHLALADAPAISAGQESSS